jgi:alkylation response protein AidB-like acyl-CoA dehydrogenase
MACSSGCLESFVVTLMALPTSTLDPGRLHLASLRLARLRLSDPAQLYCEPNAASDLAALKTRAVERRCHDWGLLLARADTKVAKHKGISCFLVSRGHYCRQRSVATARGSIASSLGRCKHTIPVDRSNRPH